MTNNISLIQGNLFRTDMETIAITVNCVGIMGKGIALTLKNQAKPAYEKYRELCEAGEMNLGKSVIYDKPLDDLDGKTILFFPTKGHWRSRSELFQIKKGLEHFAENYHDMGITSIAFPALGCGHGGLNWHDVKPLMYEYLEDLDLEIEIYEPGEQTETNLSENQTEKKSNPKPSKITDYSK
ncbi:MAG: macro domain-containing protein [Thaumarchaeota archaeon]|jgi:O-acetyl-ADP-ribose deacetylase (regulator of RNase III)|nr:macro domain-containing protein [Nitrososphaerota archaeon]